MTIGDPALFPIRHDWARPFKVRREWATDVQPATDGSELRVQLRASASVTMEMHGVFLSEMGAGKLLAAWRGASQPLRFYAPLWCDVAELGADLAAGAASITADLTDRPFFADGGYAMLYREITPGLVTAEVVTINTLSGTTGFSVAGTVANDYLAAGTRVVPCRVMWLDMPTTLTWVSPLIAQADLSFTDNRPSAGYGIAGTDTTGTVDSIAIYAQAVNRTGEGQTGLVPYEFFADAIVKDALGLPLDEQSVTWTSTDPALITITPSIDSRLARIYVNTAGGSITATCGSVSKTIGVN